MGPGPYFIMNEIDSLLMLLGEAPDTQLEESMAHRCQDLVGQPAINIAIQMKKILDECAHASLASDFTMMTMDHVWTLAKREVKEQLAKEDPPE